MLQLIVQSASIQPPQSPPPSFSVTVYFRDVKKKTRVIEDDNNPIWNETLVWHLGPRHLEKDAFLQAILRDLSLGKSERTFGIGTIFLRSLVENPHEPLILTNLPLVSHTTHPTKSTITLKITYLPQEAEHKSAIWQNLGISRKEVGWREVMVAGHPVRMPLTSKPQEFQVQMRIFEAHQLHGHNIDPVVKILIGNHEYRTRIMKGNNPFFNEKFFHNFHHIYPTDLFEEIILIKVMDSKAKRSNSEIGRCQIDIGIIYFSPAHTFMRKWLGLCLSNQPNLGIRGYLKVTISVIGVGDQVPVDHEPLHETGEVDKNLFISATIPIQLATYSFFIYSAEDLHLKTTVASRFFSHTVKERKSSMNPMLELEIAGKILKTSAKHHTEKPRWDQTLKFSVQLPCMTNHIKLRVLDWNKKEHNEVIGTANLNITHLSSVGTLTKEFSGFLPCFGPSYLILHGGEKALSQNLPEEDPFPLDSTEEGLIYRGRVLLELVTEIQEKKMKASSPITTAALIEKELHRQKYGLCLIFLSSTMMPAFKNQVHFEVTIGHYGNKMDLNYKPLASTTQYSQAVCNGSSYHYLPWHNSKPVVTLSSLWEDISYRMNSLNILHVARDRLRSNLKTLKSIQNSKNPALPRVWKKLLQELEEDCKRPLPSLTDQPHVTILDQNLWYLRTLVLQELADEASTIKHEHTKMLSTAENWLYRLNAVLPEPQSSIPDVVVWLLCKKQRVAYARIPAHTILFSQAGPLYSGKFCGKVQTLFMQYSKEQELKTLLEAKEEKGTMAAQLRVCMWLGRVLDSHHLEKIGHNDFIFYSETYENQAKKQGKWGSKGLKNYPSFSDVTGHEALPKENFQVPQGWHWHGNWFVKTQMKFLLGTDTNQNQILDEVYENQTRDSWARWVPATIPNTDIIGQPVKAREDMKCPEGWTIKQDWNVELNQAVDNEGRALAFHRFIDMELEAHLLQLSHFSGWEYGVEISPSDIPKVWSAVEKIYHSWRRRRWVRQRYQNTGEQRQEQKQSPALSEEEGWEYGSFESKFDPDPQSGSMFRRRCWHRRMVPIKDISISPIFFLERTLEMEKKIKKEQEKKEEETIKEKKDLMTSTKSLMERHQQPSTPLIYYITNKPHYYQLFCYIYQARNLMTHHIQIFLNSSIQVVFLNYGQRTRTLELSLVPTWDQTLVFDNILLYEKPHTIEENPPFVCLELWQLNTYGKLSSWGRSMCTPVVCLDLQMRVLPQLSWHSISKDSGEEEGEILAAFELILQDEMVSNQKSPLMSIPWKNGYYTLPQNIQPSLKKTAIEILAWGLRNIHKANSPWLLVECGGTTLKTAQIKDYYSNPNFPQAALLLTLFLPQEEAYAPPLVLKVVDQQNVGIQMMVGQAIVYCLQPYFCDPWAEGYVPPRLPAIPKKKRDVSEDRVIPLLHTSSFSPTIRGADCSLFPGPKTSSLPQFFDFKNPASWVFKSLSSKEKHVDEVDWWSKMFWASGETSKMWNHEKDYYALKVYDCELEAVPDFQGLQDFCQTFKLYNDKKTKDRPVVGEFKGLFRIYPLPENPKQASPPRQFQNLSEKESRPQQCLVRVYVIRAINLQPKDNHGLCDPYVILKLGKTELGNRNQYKPNTLDPIFGSIFELKCTIPLEKDLEITLFDYDLITPDDKIGSTVIDLENRLLSSFGARCGLPKSYCLSGPFQWRDQLTPSQLLERYAHRKGLPPPDFSNEDCIIFNGRIFKLYNFEQHTPPIKYLGSPKERLALYLLQAQGQVPEHVETRTLYSNTQPGIDQGKVQLWVDIFPLHLGPPRPAVDISIRKTKWYELRCIIWETRNVDLKDINVTGERMSDIYIKGWMLGMEDNMQKTDIHYRSLTGTGNFNWRFIFTFNYLPTEQVCILSKKKFIWSLDSTVEKTPPQLLIQVWDNDKFLPDDFLGTLELDLCEMPTPAWSSKECTLSMMENKPNGSFKLFHKHVSLFKQKTTTGWWPCQVLDNGKWRLSGKVKMTLEVLTKEEAEERPAGKGRSEPNQYPTIHAPIRPETSFLWLLSPWLSIRYVCWKRYRWKLAFTVLMLCILFLVLTFIYSTPNYLAMKVIKPEFRIAAAQPKVSEVILQRTPATPAKGSSEFHRLQIQVNHKNSNYLDIFSDLSAP